MKGFPFKNSHDGVGRSLKYIKQKTDFTPKPIFWDYNFAFKPIEDFFTLKARKMHFVSFQLQ